jgi:hypothetical protein
MLHLEHHHLDEDQTIDANYTSYVCRSDGVHIIDASKAITADFRHRALRHHAEGIFMAEAIFGATITLSSGRVIPTRWVGEQHVIEDLGFIPSFADWVRCIRPEPWMGRARRIEHEVEPPYATLPAAEVA